MQLLGLNRRLQQLSRTLYLLAPAESLGGGQQHFVKRALFRMSGFAAGESTWVERLGDLRNTIRQELIGAQSEEHVRDGPGCWTSVADRESSRSGWHVARSRPARSG